MLLNIYIHELPGTTSANKTAQTTWPSCYDGVPASPQVPWRTSGSDTVLQATLGWSEGLDYSKGFTQPPPPGRINLGSVLQILPVSTLAPIHILYPCKEQKSTCCKIAAINRALWIITACLKLIFVSHPPVLTGIATCYPELPFWRDSKTIVYPSGLFQRCLGGRIIIWKWSIVSLSTVSMHSKRNPISGL